MDQWQGRRTDRGRFERFKWYWHRYRTASNQSWDGSDTSQWCCESWFYRSTENKLNMIKITCDEHITLLISSDSSLRGFDRESDDISDSEDAVAFLLSIESSHEPHDFVGNTESGVVEHFSSSCYSDLHFAEVFVFCSGFLSDHLILLGSDRDVLVVFHRCKRLFCY